MLFCIVLKMDLLLGVKGYREAFSNNDCRGGGKMAQCLKDTPVLVPIALLGSSLGLQSQPLVDFMPTNIHMCTHLK